MTLASTAPAPAAPLNLRRIVIAASLLALLALYFLAPPALTAWPKAWILPMAKGLTLALTWVAETPILGGIALKDILRASAKVIEGPTEALQILLVDGFARGYGAQAVQILPPLSWAGLAGAAILTGWRFGGLRLAGFALFTTGYLLAFGLWHSAMQTFSLLIVAVPIGAATGLWLGVFLWRRPRIQNAALIAFDQFQTVPIFAYLVPILIFFGLGYPPAILATVVYAVPTMIRTTVAGLNRAQQSVGELAKSVGCSKRQELWTILIPTAQAELRVGVNQIVMLSFSCAVLASLVGTNGMGYDILIALRQLNIGRGMEAGLGITLAAILLDQLFQNSVNRAQKNRLSRRNFLGLVVLVLALPTALSFADARLANYPAEWTVSTGGMADAMVEWVNVNLFWLMDAIKSWLLVWLLLPVKAFMLSVPWSVGVLFVAFLGWLIGGPHRALLVGLLMLAIAAVGLWQVTMLTVYLCTVSVIVAAALGIPLGILAGRSPLAARIILPVIDTLQTLPSFVYLIPVIMFFGSGEFPAFIAIAAYAICPAVRFTELGIRQIPVSLRECATQLGMTPMQRLFKVDLPTAAPQILMGLNGTIVMALAMLVITALIGTKDLGRETLNALAKVNPGQGLTAGLAVACLAVIANRLVGGLAEKKLSAQAQPK